VSNYEYVMQIDTTHENVTHIPADSLAVMGYVTGDPQIDWTVQDWNRFTFAGKVRVDQSDGLAHFAAGAADVADVERGAGTLAQFIEAAKERKAKDEDSTLYVSYDNLWGAVHAVQAAGLTLWVYYFVANYNWSLAEAIAFLNENEDVVGVQFASPSSNPDTDLPGSAMLLREAICDLSVKRGSWFPAPVPAAVGWTE
jgi:hypothetical protein